MSIRKKIRAKFDHLRRKQIFRGTDKFRDRAHRCIFCNKVIFSSPKKYDPKVYWEYFTVAMICDECAKHKTTGMTHYEYELFWDEADHYANAIFINNLLKHGYLED